MQHDEDDELEATRPFVIRRAAQSSVRAPWEETLVEPRSASAGVEEQPTTDRFLQPTPGIACGTQPSIAYMSYLAGEIVTCERRIRAWTLIGVATLGAGLLVMIAILAFISHSGR